MGDAGSTLIGYLLASISVVGGWYQDERSIIVSLSIPMLILGILVFDILMTSILRFVEGKVKTIPELLSYAGRDHVHHRIEKMGFNVVQTVFILFAVANFLGALALVVRVIDFSGLLLILFLLFFVVIMLIIKLHRVEMQFLSAKSNN
jgi:UDP-GlcNAc:undecaprenyl-phosphate GlcNAc-1-phosphate transferase